MADMKRVLFVCVENSNRSQMAEAFARLHGGDAVEAQRRFEAFRRDKSKGDPIYAGNRLRPEHTRFEIARRHCRGRVRCGHHHGLRRQLPVVPAKRREDWGLPDPKHMGDDGYRAVRDDISARLQKLLADL